MPPKMKRLGRPPGSKNKKSIAKIKQENDNENGISDISDVTAVPPDLPKEQNFDKKTLYNCKRCPNKNFKFKKNYQEHLIMEHSTLPGSVGCKHCHVVCPDQETLDLHVSKIHEREVFKCEYCDKEFVRQAHVLRHMAQKGCDGSQVASFPCEICDAKFTRKDNLIVHLRQMHIKKTFYSCKHTKCAFQSKNFTKLIRHWHSTHAAVPNQFECDSCGKATMSRAAMAKHLEIHGEKKYVCDVCEYKTYTIEVMRRHILTHVEDKPYKCAECKTSFIQRAQLERHLEKHLMNKCDVCGQDFGCPARFMIHQRQHEGIMELVCPFDGCPMADEEFRSEAKLIAHVNTHMVNKRKVYLCEVCNKPFHSELNMRRHLNTHALDKPRRCMYCVRARAYVRGQQLVRHVRKYHGHVFNAHLAHVRNVLNMNKNKERVTKSEMDSILNLLDAESERILEGYGHSGVLYAGMQLTADVVPVEHDHDDEDEEDTPLMSEGVLAENLTKLLTHLIDEDTLQCLGWPEESIDVILEKVIEQCGAKPADREMWSRVQRLRENAKHLFLYVVDDKSVTRMLGTHTIDQIVKHLLTQAAEGQAQPEDQKAGIQEL